MSGSDLDGDVYWVTWDEKLVNLVKFNVKPLLFPNPKAETVKNITSRHCIDFFIEYIQFDCLGTYVMLIAYFCICVVCVCVLMQNKANHKFTVHTHNNTIQNVCKPRNCG